MVELYSIYDKKAEVYSKPFITDNKIFACRELAAALRNPDTTIAVYPEDYDLYCVGTFDVKTGKVTEKEHPEFVISALECNRMNKKEVSDGKGA